MDGGDEQQLSMRGKRHHCRMQSAKQQAQCSKAQRSMPDCRTGRFRRFLGSRWGAREGWGRSASRRLQASNHKSGSDCWLQNGEDAEHSSLSQQRLLNASN